MEGEDAPGRIASDTPSAGQGLIGDGESDGLPRLASFVIKHHYREHVVLAINTQRMGMASGLIVDFYIIKISSHINLEIESLDRERSDSGNEDIQRLSFVTSAFFDGELHQAGYRLVVNNGNVESVCASLGFNRAPPTREGFAAVVTALGEREADKVFVYIRINVIVADINRDFMLRCARGNGEIKAGLDERLIEGEEIAGGSSGGNSQRQAVGWRPVRGQLNGQRHAADILIDSARPDARAFLLEEGRVVARLDGQPVRGVCAGNKIVRQSNRKVDGLGCLRSVIINNGDGKARIPARIVGDNSYGQAVRKGAAFIQGIGQGPDNSHSDFESFGRNDISIRHNLNDMGADTLKDRRGRLREANYERNVIVGEGDSVRGDGAKFMALGELIGAALRECKYKRLVDLIRIVLLGPDSNGQAVLIVGKSQAGAGSSKGIGNAVNHKINIVGEIKIAAIKAQLQVRWACKPRRDADNDIDTLALVNFGA